MRGWPHLGCWLPFVHLYLSLLIGREALGLGRMRGRLSSWLLAILHATPPAGVFPSQVGCETARTTLGSQYFIFIIFFKVDIMEGRGLSRFLLMSNGLDHVIFCQATSIMWLYTFVICPCINTDKTCFSKLSQKLTRC